MAELEAEVHAEAWIEATVIRADGTVEELGRLTSDVEIEPSFLEQIKQAWREGRQEGRQ